MTTVHAIVRTAAPAVVLGAFALAGCGYDDPIEGWGPGSPPVVVVVVAEPAPDTSPDEAAPPASTVPPPPVYAPNGQVQRVRSLDNSFRDETVEVVVGTEIWWTNDGRNEHDVLPVDDDQDWGAERDVFQPGDEYRHVFLEPGTYRYYCSIHGTKDVGMVGTIVVTEPA